LLQRIRDEAHRYGITSHRNKRTKLGLASQLDSIPGIGPARRRALLRRFGSIEGIRAAAIDELKAVIPESAAQSIKANLP
jgi:excinuclease ABC subunit C